MFYAPHIPKTLYLNKDDAFYRKAAWRLSFALRPHRCKISNKWIWLKYGYQGTATWHGPGEPVSEVNWHDRNEHIIFQLKR